MLSVAYYGSFFTDNVNSVAWQDVADPTKSATMAVAPSNQFNQFTFMGAEKFKGNMKLVVSGSYGRNTQNDPFLGPSTANNGQLAFGLPVPSLNGLVVSSMVNAKFTAKPSKKLNLTAAYKFFNRDNQTPVHTYLFQDANESKSGASPFAGLYGLPATLGSNTNIYQNRAYSSMTNQADGRGGIRNRKETVAPGPLPVAESRPQLPWRLDQLRRRAANRRTHAGRGVAQDIDWKLHWKSQLCVFVAEGGIRRGRIPGARSHGKPDSLREAPPRAFSRS